MIVVLSFASLVVASVVGTVVVVARDGYRAIPTRPLY